MKTLKIFDCSNLSDRRPFHRGGGGPVMNDILRYLREQAPRYNAEFIPAVNDADVIITNDVFPDHVLDTGIPRVKRMDGIFFQEQFKDRNEPYNLAAMKADHVIFISDFSRDSLLGLYGIRPKSFNVIRNKVDPLVFNYRKKKISSRRRVQLIASASDWKRPEKRLDAILTLAKMRPDVDIVLIGTCTQDLPPNVKSLGYFSEPHLMAAAIQSADGMVSFAYKDACPKTVWQGVFCGLPVLYSESGGHPEIVHSGIGVLDNKRICFEQAQPRLLDSDIDAGIDLYLHQLHALTIRAQTFDQNSFYQMIADYFSILRSLSGI